MFTCAAPVGKFTCWRIIRKLTADDFLSLYVVQMLLTHSLLFTHLSFYHSLLLCVKIKDIGKCNILKIKSENFLPFLSFFSHGVRTVLTHSDSMPESASGQHDGSFFLTFYFKARTRDGRGTMFIGSVCKIKIQQILSECIPDFIFFFDRPLSFFKTMVRDSTYPEVLRLLTFSFFSFPYVSSMPSFADRVAVHRKYGEFSS